MTARSLPLARTLNALITLAHFWIGSKATLSPRPSGADIKKAGLDARLFSTRNWLDQAA
jgi:hypothetical protein